MAKRAPSPLSAKASNSYTDMTDEFLKNSYVPKVYQASIYSIDYDMLKSNGIKLISFDIDETIAGDNEKDPPKPAITLFENLKKKGFKLILLTNAGLSRAKHIGTTMDVPYIYDAKKPLTKNFKKILRDHNLTSGQMAHVGNSQFDDVAGGNSIGIVTCLVKNSGGKPLSKDEQSLRNELQKRNIWTSNNKFYQLEK